MIKKIIPILVIVGIILPVFSFAQEPSVKVPETLQEGKEIGEKAAGEVKTKLPGILEKIWKEDILPFWQKIYNWFKVHIFPWFKKIGEKVISIFRKETEKRKPGVKEEFEKEKQEVKEEAPKVGKTLWEKFKELIK